MAECGDLGNARDTDNSCDHLQILGSTAVVVRKQRLILKFTVLTASGLNTRRD